MINLFGRILNKVAKIPFPLLEERYCIACKKNVGWFLPYNRGRKISSFLNSLDLVGSDISNFSCPRCWSHDRERHLYLYLRESNFLERFRGAKILHFAPEAWFSKVISEHSPLLYIKADLNPSSDDVKKINMLSIQYSNEVFDFVIANHVLEHVDVEAKALAELYRVLKPGGYAILQTPYCSKLKHTFSDEGIDNDEARFQAYGQEDHVRLYGADIFERFSGAGFINRVKQHQEILDKFKSDRYGVNGNEPLFLFEKATRC